jgi:hypothetical protein
MTRLTTGITGLIGKHLDDGSYEPVEVHGFGRGGQQKSLSRCCIRNERHLRGSFALFRLLEGVELQGSNRDLQRLKETKPSAEKYDS